MAPTGEGEQEAGGREWEEVEGGVDAADAAAAYSEEDGDEEEGPADGTAGADDDAPGELERAMAAELRASAQSLVGALTPDLVLDRLVYGFNTYLVEFLLFAKKADPQLKQRLIKRGFRVVDRKSPDYVAGFVARNEEDWGAVEALFDAGLPLQERCRAGLTSGLSVGDVMEVPGVEGSSDARDVVLMYAMMLSFIADLYRTTRGGDKDDVWCCDRLFRALVQGVRGAQIGEDYEGLLRSVVDDDAAGRMRAVLDAVREVSARDAAAVAGEAAVGPSGLASATDDVGKHVQGEGLDMREALNAMRDSKLGAIAEELAASVDADTQRELMECMRGVGGLGAGVGGIDEMIRGMMGGGAIGSGGAAAGVMGKLVQQVTSSITSKIQSGELSQQDIINDAFKMMRTTGMFAPR